LPAKLREVVVTRLWGGLTFQEIGQVTGTSESTAHRRYHAALRRIRRTISRQSCTNEN
jgi:DNA-directed RNA polymerase specialized sigma24 family protein